MIADKYGREITDEGNGIFSIDGMTIDTHNKGINAAISTFDAMAPEWWIQPRQPLTPVGALATLLAVTDILLVEDAANAVQLAPEDLVAEAEAWAAARDLTNPL